MRTDPCADCLEQLGLCQYHAPAILPQRAIPPWVRLIGQTHAEQRKLQTLDVAEVVAVERAKRRRARASSRSAGIRGLLVHIATA